MEFMINGRNLAVSDRFREYTAEKVGKIEQLGDKVQRVDAKVTKQPNARQSDSALTVELTVLGRGPVIRAEASAADKFAAFDLAYTKLLERLRRARDRRKVHHGRQTPTSVRQGGVEQEGVLADGSSIDDAQAPEDGYAIENDVPAGDSPVLIRRKVFQGTPMSLDDAVDNMELVGHAFYLFVDSGTGAPSAVYRRSGYTYGVITLDAKCVEGGEDPHEELLAYRSDEPAVSL